MLTAYACCYCCWQLYLASKEYGATAASDPTLASEAHVCYADILATAHQLTRYLCGKNDSDSQPCFPLSPDAYCCCIMTQQNACYTPASAAVTACQHNTPSNVSMACSGTESRFLQASMAAAVNKPIISDEEYDELKAKLRNKNSKVVQQVGGCSPQPCVCQSYTRYCLSTHKLSACMVTVIVSTCC